MIKTKEWLKSVFETGDIPTGEDYENLIDSFWHKSEIGQVADGDARPVTGGSVYTAIVSAIESLNIRAVVAEILEDMLPTMLANYVTTSALSTALENQATITWVQNQLLAKADVTAMTTALAAKADISAMDGALALKANTSDMEEALAAKADTSDVNTALDAKADSTDVYTKKEANALLDAKAPVSSIPDISALATKAELAAAQASLNTLIAQKATPSDITTALVNYPTNTDLGTALSSKQEVINDLQAIRSGAAAGATAYQKPVGGIPSSDLATPVQFSLAQAESAYQKPVNGISSADLSPDVSAAIGHGDSAFNILNGGVPPEKLAVSVRDAIGRGDAAYSTLNNGVPFSSLASDVRTSLSRAESAYSTLNNGVPYSSLASGVRASLDKADTAYQKPAAGIPKTDLVDSVQTTLGKADNSVNQAYVDNGLALKANVADVPTTQTCLNLISAAQALNGAIGRITALETAVGTPAASIGSHGTGLTGDIEILQELVGDAPVIASITEDLKETRAKTNEVITALSVEEALANLLANVNLLQTVPSGR